MKVFLVLVFLLGLLFILHLTWWRIARPRRGRPVLLGLFIVGGVLLAPVVGFLLSWIGIEPLSFIQWLNVGLGTVAFALAYVVTYSALEADSPTLSLIRHIASSGRAGLREAELREFMSARPFLGARIAALIEEGMVQQREERIHLADHPYTLFRLVLLHRDRVLRIKCPGG